MSYSEKFTKHVQGQFSKVIQVNFLYVEEQTNTKGFITTFTLTATIASEAVTPETTLFEKTYEYKDNLQTILKEAEAEMTKAIHDKIPTREKVMDMFGYTKC